MEINNLIKMNVCELIFKRDYYNMADIIIEKKMIDTL